MLLVAVAPYANRVVARVLTLAGAPSFSFRGLTGHLRSIVQRRNHVGVLLHHADDLGFPNLAKLHQFLTASVEAFFVQDGSLVQLRHHGVLGALQEVCADHNQPARLVQPDHEALHVVVQVRFLF